ncbi:MAG: diaminopimelate epimerase [Flavobacteriales bacterium]
MELRFSKWHGTGNDFILVDDRDGGFPSADIGLVERLCDRHFGIGSDGLILVQRASDAGLDYHMEFFNPDGSKSFCGNGSRCAFAFWRAMEGGRDKARFTAIDGIHDGSTDASGVRISLAPPKSVERIDGSVDLIHTGSPHLLVWVDDPEAIDIVPEAHRYRYNDRFKAEGVNVNFVRWYNGQMEMRTYERGVEAETLSCGTGVTAAAIDAIHRKVATGLVVAVRTRGGALRVEVSMDNGEGFAAVDLIGPVQDVFQGTVII